MHYPWWYVPGLTAPMLVAFIAVVHVVVSHYAVGGGILIAMENAYGIAKDDRKYREYWKKQTKFFVLLTVAFGAITGVGIWWTIGLTSPLATETLIRTFVFGWAIEWVFFIIEIVAAFAFYYYWDRLPHKTHIIIGWIYAIAAWISLVLITGITGFMLNADGLIANWSETGNFWHAFFNLQFVPQTILRTGASVMLAVLYVYLHASWTLSGPEDAELLEKVVRRLSKPLLFGAFLMAVGIPLSIANFTESAKMVLERAAVLNVFLAIIVGLAGIMFLLILFGPVLYPKSMNFRFAVSLFIFGFVAFTLSEFVREAVRKPYIVDQTVLGNQIYVSEIDRSRETGFIANSTWAKRYDIEKHLPEFKIAPDTPVGEIEALLDKHRAVLRGEVLFMHHCNDCHVADHGYTAVAPLIAGESKERLTEFIKRLDEPVYSMPPWCGTAEEAEWLAAYLESIRPEYPERKLPQ